MGYTCLDTINKAQVVRADQKLRDAKDRKPHPAPEKEIEELEKELRTHQTRTPREQGVKLHDGRYYEYRSRKNATRGDTFVPDRHLTIHAWHEQGQEVMLGHIGIPRKDVCDNFNIDTTKVVVSAFEISL